MYATAPAFGRRLSCDRSGLGHLPTVQRARWYLRGGMGALISVAPRRVTGPYDISTATINPGMATAATGPWTQRNRSNWQPSWRNQKPAPALNTTGQSSTILNYDAAGNPVYSVPPTGVAITSYDASGNPIYSTPPAGNPVYSVPPAGVAITSYDASGNPIYSTPPACAVVTGTDAQGNPIYGAAGDTSGYSSVLNWLSGSTLISGLPNWGVAAGAVAGFLLLQSKLGGKR